MLRQLALSVLEQCIQFICCMMLLFLYVHANYPAFDECCVHSLFVRAVTDDGYVFGLMILKLCSFVYCMNHVTLALQATVDACPDFQSYDACNKWASSYTNETISVTHSPCLLLSDSSNKPNMLWHAHCCSAAATLGQPPASQHHIVAVQHGIVSPFAFHQPAVPTLPVVPEAGQLDCHGSSNSYKPRSLRAQSEPGKASIAQLIKDRSASLGEMTSAQLELEGNAYAKGPSKLGSGGASGLCQVWPCLFEPSLALT